MENNSVVISVEKYDYFKRLEKDSEGLPDGMIRIKTRTASSYYECPVFHKTYEMKKEDYDKELNDKISKLEASISLSRKVQDIRGKENVRMLTKITAIEQLVRGDYPFLSSGLVKKLKRIISQ